MQALLEYVRKMIADINKIVFYYRVQNTAKALQISRRFIDNCQTFIGLAIQYGLGSAAEFFLPILEELLAIIEGDDVIMLADLFEKKLYESCLEVQKILVSELMQEEEPHVYWYDNMSSLKKKDYSFYKRMDQAEEDEQRIYSLGWTLTGELSLTVGTEDHLISLHSVVDPRKEAFYFAKAKVDLRYNRYVLLGMGLGYVAEELLEYEECEEIVVLETDLEQLRIAFRYVDCRKILDSSKVKIVLCKDSSEIGAYVNRISQETRILAWLPSVKTIEDCEVRKTLENYILEITAAENAFVTLTSNFRKNQLSGDEEVSVLKNEFAGKEMVLIAGGPSLDEAVSWLRKEQTGDKILVAVGKVAKKLLQSGIRPDYLVMTDQKAGTVCRIEGIEECGIPLIYLSTVASNVVERYRGKRYIAYQEGFDLAVDVAKQKGYPLFQTGGSVATFALDLGISFGCKKIYCVGLDLGYPNGKTHAKGLGTTVVESRNLRQIKAVNGNLIQTNQSMDIFRRWIEKRIQDVQGVAFINLSGGARIEGMIDCKLEEIDGIGGR